MNPESSSSSNIMPNKSPKEELIEFSDHPSFNFGSLLIWISAVFAILITLFFWWQSRDVAAAVVSKQTEKQNIIADITSSSNLEVEKKADNFKSAVAALKEAKTERYSNSQFLKDISAKVTNDVSIESLTLAEDGVLNLNGKTSSYRSVADLMLALESWDSLSNVDLSSVSMQEGQDKKVYVIFAITANVDKTKKQTSSTQSSTSSQTGNTNGGTNAQE